MKKALVALAVLLCANSAYAISSKIIPIVGSSTSRVSFTADATRSPVCIDSSEKELIFFLDADYVSGSSTLDVKIQESWNASDWKDLLAFTQVTTTDATEKVSINIGNSWRCYRAVIDVGASGSPNYNVKVILTTNPL